MTEKGSRIKILGRMDHIQDHTHEHENRVYSPEGISPTICTSGGDSENHGN